MSKNVLKYVDTKLIKRKQKTGRGKRFFVFSFCLFLIGAVIFASSIFADALTVGSFSFLFNSNKIKVNKHNYYAVTMGAFETEQEAQSVASGASVMGAGAYVWQHENTFYVVGNVYSNKSEAETVLKNISGNNYNVAIKEINYGDIYFDDDNYSKEQKQVILNSITFIDEVFTRCYDFSIKFDKGEVVSTVVSSALNTLKGEVKIWSGKIDAINSVVVKNETLYIKNAYISLAEELEAGVLKVIDGSSVNKDLKYLTTAVAIIKYNLYSNINSL